MRHTSSIATTSYCLFCLFLPTQGNNSIESYNAKTTRQVKVSNKLLITTLCIKHFCYRPIAQLRPRLTSLGLLTLPLLMWRELLLKLLFKMSTQCILLVNKTSNSQPLLVVIFIGTSH